VSALFLQRYPEVSSTTVFEPPVPLEDEQRRGLSKCSYVSCHFTQVGDGDDGRSYESNTR
jgi:hypothetical protein